MVASNAILAQDNWVKVSDVFARDETEILQSAGLTGWDDPRFKRYQARLAQLRRIRGVRLGRRSLHRRCPEEVTEIFVRVNSQGVKLRSSDLAMAQTLRAGAGRSTCSPLTRSRWRPKGFDFDLSVYLQDDDRHPHGSIEVPHRWQPDQGATEPAWRTRNASSTSLSTTCVATSESTVPLFCPRPSW